MLPEETRHPVNAMELLRPKKSLGQHFLTDQRILRRIADACSDTASDTVVEIGPGRGALTRLLAQRFQRIYALELDARLIAPLRAEFEFFPQVQILHQDALTFDPSTLAWAHGLKIVGNIPYYISSPLLERLFSYRGLIKEICITVQKEFARRVVAPPGSKEYGSLSCFAQYYSEPEILFYIKRGCFSPAPKVDSAFLRLRLQDRVAYEGDPQGEKLFFHVMRAAFSQRRKMLKNTLDGIVEADALQKFFISTGINPKARAEILSLRNFMRLSEFARQGRVTELPSHYLTG
jgi:16S rRNA (adenine1518-N6/adenine1519-N6)-dimethyltransferase